MLGKSDTFYMMRVFIKTLGAFYKKVPCFCHFPRGGIALEMHHQLGAAEIFQLACNLLF